MRNAQLYVFAYQRAIIMLDVITLLFLFQNSLSPSPNSIDTPFTSAITIVHYALCIVHYYALFVAHCVHRFDGHCTGSRCKACQHAEDTQ